MTFWKKTPKRGDIINKVQEKFVKRTLQHQEFQFKKRFKPMLVQQTRQKPVKFSRQQQAFAKSSGRNKKLKRSKNKKTARLLPLYSVWPKIWPSRQVPPRQWFTIFAQKISLPWPRKRSWFQKSFVTHFNKYNKTGDRFLFLRMCSRYKNYTKLQWFSKILEQKRLRAWRRIQKRKKKGLFVPFKIKKFWRKRRKISRVLRRRRLNLTFWLSKHWKRKIKIRRSKKTLRHLQAWLRETVRRKKIIDSLLTREEKLKPHKKYMKKKRIISKHIFRAIEHGLFICRRAERPKHKTRKLLLKKYKRKKNKALRIRDKGKLSRKKLKTVQIFLSFNQRIKWQKKYLAKRLDLDNKNKKQLQIWRKKKIPPIVVCNQKPKYLKFKMFPRKFKTKLFVFNVKRFKLRSQSKYLGKKKIKNLRRRFKFQAKRFLTTYRNKLFRLALPKKKYKLFLRNWKFKIKNLDKKKKRFKKLNFKFKDFIKLKLTNKKANRRNCLWYVHKRRPVLRKHFTKCLTEVHSCKPPRMYPAFFWQLNKRITKKRQKISFRRISRERKKWPLRFSWWQKRRIKKLARAPWNLKWQIYFWRRRAFRKWIVIKNTFVVPQMKNFWPTIHTRKHKKRQSTKINRYLNSKILLQCKTKNWKYVKTAAANVQVLNPRKIKQRTIRNKPKHFIVYKNFIKTFLYSKKHNKILNKLPSILRAKILRRWEIQNKKQSFKFIRPRQKNKPRLRHRDKKRKKFSLHVRRIRKQLRNWQLLRKSMLAHKKIAKAFDATFIRKANKKTLLFPLTKKNWQIKKRRYIFAKKLYKVIIKKKKLNKSIQKKILHCHIIKAFVFEKRKRRVKHKIIKKQTATPIPKFVQKNQSNAALLPLLQPKRYNSLFLKYNFEKFPSTVKAMFGFGRKKKKLKCRNWKKHNLLNVADKYSKILYPKIVNVVGHKSLQSNTTITNSLNLYKTFPYTFGTGKKRIKQLNRYGLIKDWRKPWKKPYRNKRKLWLLRKLLKRRTLNILAAKRAIYFFNARYLAYKKILSLNSPYKKKNIFYTNSKLNFIHYMYKFKYFYKKINSALRNTDRKDLWSKPFWGGRSRRLKKLKFLFSLKNPSRKQAPWKRFLFFRRALYALQSYNIIKITKAPFKTKRNKIYRNFINYMKKKAIWSGKKPNAGGRRNFRLQKMIYKIHRRFYGQFTERQFLKIWQRNQNLKPKFGGRFSKYLNLLELNISVLLIRLGLTPNIRWARYFVKLGWVYVNDLTQHTTTSKANRQYCLDKTSLFPLSNLIRNKQNSFINLPSIPIKNDQYKLGKHQMIYFAPPLREYALQFFRKKKWNYQIVPKYLEFNSKQNIAVVINPPNKTVFRRKARVNKKILPYIIN